jgi:hypothetical protein
MAAAANLRDGSRMFHFTNSSPIILVRLSSMPADILLMAMLAKPFRSNPSRELQ